MLDTIYSQIGAAVVLLTCGFALWKGERLEQWGGGILFLAWLGTIFIQDETGIARMQFAVLAVDVAVLGAMGVLAWKSERSWPIWASACQAITVAVHFAYILDFRIPSFAYFSAFTVASYGVLVSLAIGTFIVWREREALRPPAA